MDSAVAEIAAIIAQTAAKGMDEVGALLLKKFYADDPKLYASTSPKKHASLKKVIKRCQTVGLPVSATFISNAVRIAVVSKQLPEAAAFRRLPDSHRVELLRLNDPKKIAQAAEEAVDDPELTVRALRAIVAGMIGDAPRGRGRPTTPRVARAVRQIERVLRKDQTWELAFSRGDIESLNAEQRTELHDTVEHVAGLVQELRTLLKK